MLRVLLSFEKLFFVLLASLLMAGLCVPAAHAQLHDPTPDPEEPPGGGGAECPPGTEGTEVMLGLFLRHGAFAELREDSGTTGLENEEIELVTDPSACGSLEEFLETSPAVEEIDESKWDQAYYRVGSFYFISYDRKRLGLGYTPIQVLDSDFDLIGHYWC